jgi:hypothetical protein
MPPIALAQNTADGDGIVEPGENEAEELRKAAQNPMADLISFPIQNNTNWRWFWPAIQNRQAAGEHTGPGFLQR